MSDKVVSIFSQPKVDETEEDKKARLALSEVQRKNAEKKARLASEREKANKGVIRSYRLKH